MTSGECRSYIDSFSSYNPQFVKYLSHNRKQQEQYPRKEFVEDIYYSNGLPPNRVATNISKDYLSNGLSKLNSENNPSTSINLKLVGESRNDCQISERNEVGYYDQWLQPPVGSRIQKPPCLEADPSTSSSSIADFKSETKLSSGERITCFMVGGEKRLCLPEILNTILKDYSLQEINNACERLHIYCSRCTIEQVDILKRNQIIPNNAPSCGLITQTDAERLCANLFSSRSQSEFHQRNEYENLYSIKVEHKCFGKCSGRFYPCLYLSIDSQCIQCDQCYFLFSPRRFVSHGHKSEENRICHWGFNSDNWRAYLKVRSTENLQTRQDFELIKEKFLKKNHFQEQKRFIQTEDCFQTSEKRRKTSQPSLDLCSNNNHNLDFYSQNDFLLKKRKTNVNREYSFESSSSAFNRTETERVSSTNNSSQPLVSHIVRSRSPSTNSSINNFNDFSLDGIRKLVESSVTSKGARHQLITYITQLQQTCYAQRSKTNSLINQNQLNENLKLKCENEYLRQRLAKLEQTLILSDRCSSIDHNQEEDNTNGHLNYVESNDESQVMSESIVHHKRSNNHGKYFDRKRHLLAGEQQLSSPFETDRTTTNQSKKLALEQIVDSLNEKAQAEQKENNDDNVVDDDDNEQLIIMIDNSLSPLSTTSDNEFDDIHIEDENLHQNQD